MNKLKDGLYLVSTTPFQENGDIDEAGIRSNIDWYLECGVNNIICTGSTGSFDALSQKEIMRVIDITAKQVDGKASKLAGTTATTTKACIDLSMYAESVGMEGVLIAPPFYCIPSKDELIEHYQQVADSINIPIIVYNNPGRTGIDMPPEVIFQLTSEIENVSYIKESSGDTNRVQQLIYQGKDTINVFAGSDELSLSCLMMGAKGWVATCSNIIPELALKMVNAVKQDKMKEAQKIFYKMLPLFEFMARTKKYVQICKAGMEMRGKIGGKTRRPRLPITEKESAELQKYLKDLSLL